MLTKQYTLRHGPNPDCPLEYDGPEITACTGCVIEWKDGKDVTAKMIKVRVDHSVTRAPAFYLVGIVFIQVKAFVGRKGKACCSPAEKIEKEIKADSFFTFFCPPVFKDNGERWRTKTNRPSSPWTSM